MGQHKIIELKRNNSWVYPWNLALSFFIWSNHNINFLPTKMKALAIIYYITNYATKDNCSQYQYIMFTAIIQKAYEDIQIKTIAITTPIRYADLDKFALKTFNRQVYKQEVSGHLMVSCSLSLLNYFSHDIKLWYIHLNLICHFFINIIFYRSSIL